MRKRPLKRTPMPPRKTYMNRVNPATAKQRREADPVRAKYVAEVFTCQCCGKRPATECHEIVRRSTSKKSIEYRCCYLALCHDCHEYSVSDYSKYPISRQLALKSIGDPEHFCLATVNKLRGRDEGAITWADVSKWLRMA